MNGPRMAALAMALLLGGCGGQIPGEDDPAMDPGGAPGVTPASPGDCEVNAGVAPLRRLNRIEYDNTIRDLLGVDARTAAGFLPDEKVGPFDANISSPVSEQGVDDYLKAAETLARRVASDDKTLRALAPCTAADAACGLTFAEKVGLRAYRRPLTAEETDRLQRVFTSGLADGGFSGGARLALQMMLSSPHFLYLVETGAETKGGLRTLGPWELASRLSYFLWNSMPDAALFEAARAGALAKPEGLAAEVDRMLKDERAKASLRNFHLQWLGIGKLLDRDQFDNPIGPAAHEEIARVVDDVVWSGDGKLPTLLTTRSAWVDKQLFAVYGLTGTAPASFAKVELDPKQRSGLLTRVASLATHKNPTSRGKFVREEILCQEVPPPPADVDTTLPPADPTQPPRAQWEKHVANPTCGGCHKLMDPVGFGFEHYDSTGKYRTKQGAFPVDARGEIVGTEASNGPFNGAIELSERLAGAKELAGCVTRMMTMFATGRGVDLERDRCALRAAAAAYAASGHDARVLARAIATAPGFRLRRTE